MKWFDSGNRWMAMLAAFVLILSEMVFVPSASAAVVKPGTCGDEGSNLTWTLDDQGTLTISGSGEMRDFDYSLSPEWGTGIKKLVVEDGVTSIGNEAFSYCRLLSSVSLPDTLEYIRYDAFLGCEALKSITLPEGLTDLYFGAFSRSGLTSVTLPESLEYFEGAFFGCLNLQQINVDGDDGYYWSENGVLFGYGDDGELELVAYPSGRSGTYTVPSGVERIAHYAFMECIYLTGITLQEGLVSIGGDVFWGSGITSITLPKSLSEVDDMAFYSTQDLQRINVAAGNPYFASADGVLFNFQKTKLIAFPAARTGSYSVPDGVAEIGRYAFVNSDLSSMTLPGSLRTIGDSAFNWMWEITSITVPEGVTSIGSRAFGHVESLTTVTLPRSVTEIGSYVFDGSPVSTVYCYQGSYAAQYVSSLDITVVYLGSDDGFCLPAGLERIEDQAFMGLPMTEAPIPSGCKYIGSKAFANCSKLKDVYMPDSVTSIAADAFNGSGSVRFVCESDNYAAGYARSHNIAWIIQD